MSDNEQAGPRRALLAALVMTALGGALLHYRIHPLYRQGMLAPVFLPPAVAAVVDIVLVTALFWRRDTAPLGYLLNGLLAIYGAIFMLDFSLSHFPPGWTIADLAFRSLFADCAILAGDFFVGKALYDLYTGPRPLAGVRQWLQFLNPGWWLVHTIGITAIYSLGRILWR
ncbi:MAG TPA: hypothetical protein VM221_10850 [Armatimonadota bacterium]|nr:hypothetical protein [Armatimonadota bacterium]